VPFAYPKGFYTKEVRSAKASDSRIAFTTNEDLNDLWTYLSLMWRTTRPSDTLIKIIPFPFGWRALYQARTYAGPRLRIHGLLQYIKQFYP